MRYNTTLAALIVTLLTAVTVKAAVPTSHDVTQVCFDRCIRDDTSAPSCATSCQRCGWAMNQGYLPQNDRTMPPLCEDVCGDNKSSFAAAGSATHSARQGPRFVLMVHHSSMLGTP
ncbi:hypothetical protein V8E36_009303 [Tilletia maclaganii]